MVGRSTIWSVRAHASGMRRSLGLRRVVTDGLDLPSGRLLVDVRGPTARALETDLLWWESSEAVPQRPAALGAGRALADSAPGEALDLGDPHRRVVGRPEEVAALVAQVGPVFPRRGPLLLVNVLEGALGAVQDDGDRGLILVGHGPSFAPPAASSAENAARAIPRLTARGSFFASLLKRISMSGASSSSSMMKKSPPMVSENEMFMVPPLHGLQHPLVALFAHQLV